MLAVNSGIDPLLKRPFSIHRRLGGDFQILYRVTGKGTAILSKRCLGDILEVVGPLGKGFPVKTTRDKIILVAGGVGIAPIFALAEKIKMKKPLLFYGARTKDEALCLNELKSLGIKPVISTDDGSLGAKDNIVNVLKDFLSHNSVGARLPRPYSQLLTLNPSPVTRHVIYACGPEPMLRALSLLAKEYNLKGYIALEQNMACGIGACLGCVVKTKEGYKRVCKEGPVFPIEEVVWE